MITTHRGSRAGPTAQVTADGPRPSVLVVAATPELRRSLGRILARLPLEVDEASTLGDALERAAELEPDLVVAECRVSRRRPESLSDLRAAAGAPVMVVGPDPREGVRCLETGAVVDYVRSPVWERELRARVARHVGSELDDSVLCRGDLRIDRRARILSVAGEVVDLTAREFELIDFLASEPGKAYTRHQLLEDVWGSSSTWQNANTVTEHVYRLRRKLESGPGSPRYIVTTAVGYCFTSPDDPVPAHRKVG